MATQIFDDGSKLMVDDMTGAVSATEAPWANLPSAVYTPAALNPAAGSWDDVFKYGLSRIIDAKVRPVRPENTQPLLTAPAYRLPGSLDLGALLPWLMIAGVALLVVGKMAK